jgi:hypothetical protein
LNIINGSVEVSRAIPLLKFGRRKRGLGQLKAFQLFRLIAIEETQCLHRLHREQGGNAAVQRLTEIWRPASLWRNGMQVSLDLLHDGDQITDRFYLAPRQTKNCRKIVRCVGKANLGIRPFFLECLLQVCFSLTHQILRAANG